MTDAQVTKQDSATVDRSVASSQKARTQKIGRVVSDKMEKTVVVSVDYVRRHRLYHKRITRTSKFMAHDERNECKPGDLVRIEETRPLSKHKRWIVREIIERGIQL
jgi:small subunit ribosomal protein S17